MSSFSFSNSNSSNNSSTFNPFGTVGSAWMNDFNSNTGSNMVFESDALNNQKQQQQQQQQPGQRINSAPTKLSNTNKKTNWGQLLGKTKKNNNKRKYGSTNNKRSMSLNLSILDNDMSGLQVLSPKSKPRTNTKTTGGVVKPFALDAGTTTTTTTNNGVNTNTPKHKRSKSDNSVTPIPTFAHDKNLFARKILSNRSASALGKLRGSYKCGKCGVPKKGHVCPHELPKVTNDASTQCSFDINPNIESPQIRRLVQKLQERGIITLSGANDALSVLLEDVDIPVGTYQQPTKVEVHQAATGATSSLSPSVSSKTNNKTKQNTSKNGKARKKNVKAKGTASKAKTKNPRAKKAKAKTNENSKKTKTSTKAKLIKSKKPATPKRINSLRTFDSIDSNNDDPFAMDMDPTDAFEYGEFDLETDALTDDKWFGNDIVDENYDEEMSAMLSA